MPPATSSSSPSYRTTISASSSSISVLLKSCKTSRRLLQIHAHLILRGLSQTSYHIFHFIRACYSLRNLTYASSVFHHLTSPNIFLWNFFISLNCASSPFSCSITLFLHMQRSGLAPDAYTLPPLIKASASACSLRHGTPLHALSLSSGLLSDVFVSTSLLDFYCKCSSLSRARTLFDEMPTRSLVSWTAMIAGYTAIGELGEGSRLFNLMPERNTASWNTIIDGFVKSGDLWTARKVFDEMPEKDAASFTVMIVGYSRAGDMASARALFRRSLDMADMFTWSALISGYAQNGQCNEALAVFSELTSMNLKPDEHILASVMAACAQTGSREVAKWVESYVEGSGIEKGGAHVQTAMIDMNVKCGNMEKAEEMFEGMEEGKREMVSYCSIIQGLSIHGRGEEAAAMGLRMIEEGVVPDGVAFTVILAACSHGGLVDQGFEFFEMMTKRFGMEPTADHYGCVVDMVSRCGRVREGYEMMERVPAGAANAGVWGALLGGCKLYGEVEVAQAVCRKVMEMDSGGYVMLCNIYAAAQEWVSVALLREEMKEKGVRKMAGCSWL